MINHTIIAALSAKLVERVIVSTDSADIEECAKAAGAEVFRHPPALSTDEARTFPVIQWDIEELSNQGVCPDLVAVLRATSPFRNAADIDGSISSLLAQTEADSSVSVAEHLGAHPKRLKLIDKHGYIVDAFEREGFFPVRRQEVEPVYIRTGGIYLAAPSTIREGKLWGERCLAYILPPDRALNINSAYDLAIAELISRYGLLLVE